MLRCPCRCRNSVLRSISAQLLSPPPLLTFFPPSSSLKYRTLTFIIGIFAVELFPFPPHHPRSSKTVIRSRQGATSPETGDDNKALGHTGKFQDAAFQTCHGKGDLIKFDRWQSDPHFIRSKRGTLGTLVEKGGRHFLFALRQCLPPKILLSSPPSIISY